MEEYAREVFPLEEQANGLTWMNDDDECGSYIASSAPSVNGNINGHGVDHHQNGAALSPPREHPDSEADDDDEGLVIKVPRKRDEEEWLA